MQFDKCMTCVEDLDRPEPPEFQQEVRAAIFDPAWAGEQTGLMGLQMV